MVGVKGLKIGNCSFMSIMYPIVDKDYHFGYTAVNIAIGNSAVTNTQRRCFTHGSTSSLGILIFVHLAAFASLCQ